MDESKNPPLKTAATMMAISEEPDLEEETPTPSQQEQQTPTDG